MAEIAPQNTETTQALEFSSARLAAGAVLLAVIINALWGTNPIALKLALEGFPPIGSAGIRFAIAGVGVYLWSLATGVSGRPRAGEMPWLLAVGAFFIVQITTFTLGVYWGTASHSTVLLNTYPVFVVALAHFFLPNDRATIGKGAAVLAAFAGIVVLFAGDWGAWRGHNLLGDAVQLSSALILAAQVVFTKHAVARVHPGRVVLWQMFLGAAAFLFYSFTFEGLARAAPGASAVAAVVYQGVLIGTLCFLVWTWLIRQYSASRVAIFGFVAPLVGVVLSSVVLGESLTMSVLISAGLVGLGIILSNLW